MKIIECVQGTDEWKAHRAMKVTSSNITDVLSRDKTGKGEGTTRRNYKARIVCEILTGKSMEGGYQSQAMTDGIEKEPAARIAYEALKGEFVTQVGIVVHEREDRYSCSPDGLIGEGGVYQGQIQIKCPIPAIHIGYLMAGVVPTEYQPQMQSEMACTGLPWSDFVSYCPDLPPPLQLFVVRLPRDEKRIKEIDAEVKVFLEEVDDLVERLRQKAA